MKADKVEEIKEFDEDKENVYLRMQIKARIDVSKQIEDDFKVLYKEDIEYQLDDYVKKGRI